METTIIMLAVLVLFLFCLLMKYYRLFKDERKKSEEKQRIINFFYSIVPGDAGPHPNLLAGMKIETLIHLKPQLLYFYEKALLPPAITKEDIAKLFWNVQRINNLSESPQKRFLKEDLKEVIFSRPLNYIADLLFLIVKIKCIDYLGVDQKKDLTRFGIGYTLETFLLEDVGYLRRNIKRNSLELAKLLTIKRNSIEGKKYNNLITGDLMNVALDKTIELLRNL